MRIRIDTLLVAIVVLLIAIPIATLILIRAPEFVGHKPDSWTYVVTDGVEPTVEDQSVDIGGPYPNNAIDPSNNP